MSAKMPCASKSSGGAVNRFNKFVAFLKKEKISGLLLSSQYNVSYAVGFHSPDSYALISPEGITLITDFRYAADFVKKAKPPIKIEEYKGTIFSTVIDIIKQQHLRQIGFESRHLAFAECEILNNLSKKALRWIPLKETLEPIREIKEESEIQNILKAIQITQKAFAFIKTILRSGLREIEVAAEIERFIRLQGATASAFNVIVASGPNSSYPHAAISQRIMRQGEPVVIDMGVEYNGYKCDLTRTFFLGKIKPVVQKVALIVQEAQKLAIKSIRPGAIIKDIDGAARNYISEKGFGKNFGHALGHGIGLEVHESPSINKKNHHCINKDAVITIEPGIYLAGEFGIRIEDMVLVTSTGAEVLSGNDSHKST